MAAAAAATPTLAQLWGVAPGGPAKKARVETNEERVRRKHEEVRRRAAAIAGQPRERARNTVPIDVVG